MRATNRFLFAAVLAAASAQSGPAQSASPVGGGIRMQGGGPLGGGGMANFGGGPLRGPTGGIANLGGGPLRAYGGSYQPGGNRGPVPGSIPGWAVTVTPGGIVQAPNPFVGAPVGVGWAPGQTVPNPANQFGPPLAPTQIPLPAGGQFQSGIAGPFGQAVGTVNSPTGGLAPAGGGMWVGGFGGAPAFPGNAAVGGMRGPAAAGFPITATPARVPGATVATLAPPRP